MRAAVFVEPGAPLEIRQVPDPQPGPSDIILKVKACGICGSDLHVSELHDRSGGMAPLPPGAIMGHEFAGEIVEVGREAAVLWKTGERVCALPYIACGTCVQCLSGNGHRCPDVIYGGLGRLDGAYAEYVRVGAHEGLRLPDSVDYRLGAMVEPLAVGLHAVNRAGLQSGDNVLIIGGGPVGLAVALWCRFFGARRVVVSDLQASRVEKAAVVGATDGIDATREDVVGTFKRIAGTRPSVVFDCVGVPGSQQLAVDYAPMDGHVVVVGVCMQRDTTIPVKAVTKELTVSYVFMYRKQDFQMTLDMLASQRIDPSAMLTDIVGFDAFADAFEALKHPSHQCKVLLEPELAA
jgi:(R,R)-butanediol dehydrogenase/meso-butanediol dehydrogenase/diacetyl reductase